MNKYVGVKLIEAEPQNKFTNGVIDTGEEGYKVRYEGGYESWSPKKEFEKAYLPLTESNKPNTISFPDVENFIKEIKSIKQGEKTTVTTVTLINGFEIIEASSCVDKDNFDMMIGEQICIDRVKNKIWELLGFLLQTGVNGFK